MLQHFSRTLRQAAFGLAMAGLLVPAAAQGTAPAPAAVNPAQIPVSHFVENAAFSGAILSPNAKFLAVRFGGDNQRDRLAVVDLVNNTVKVVGQMKSMDVTQFAWVNNDRLIFDSSDQMAEPGKAQRSRGLFAVNRDGSLQRAFGRVGGLVGTGNQDSDLVYVSTGDAYKGELKFIALNTMDTLTGRMLPVSRPAATRQWVMDHKGAPRVATSMEDNKTSVHYLDPVTGKWRKLSSHDYWFPGKEAMTPVAVAPDGNLFVTYRGARDKSALHMFDVKTGTLNPTPLVALEDYDFTGDVVIHKDKVLGVRYLGDAFSTVWLDDGMKAMQAKVDALLPDTINLISMAARPEIPWVLVHSYSDRHPGKFALYNTETGKLNPVGEARPKLDPNDMAEQEAVRIKARDGLVIPSWMTMPKGLGRKNLPMVVMIHGGPYLRGGQWGWNGSSQFLASRGYVVLEPEFRGSMGFGQKHYESGWRQWGLSMQNDIADVTRWAIAEGIADPKRICIAGASYGGYATLMGLVNDPDLFQCGINWVGVTDLTLLHDGHSSFRSDIGESYKKHSMPTLIGEPVRDAERFKATSPLHQAARVQRPLLMAYGALDVRVPFYHGDRFHQAVKATNKDVEMVVYDDEAHGWFFLKNRVDFWSRVEKFLNKNIGPK